MDIESDADKHAANRVKHGMPLLAAAEMDLEKAVIVEDRWFDAGETRLIAYGLLNGRLHVLWYTRRGDAIRVIGIEKGRPTRRKRYDRAP